MDYVNLNLKWDYKTRTYTSPSESHRKLSLQLLEIAANHNYIPALNLLTRLKAGTLDKDDVIYQRLKRLGGTYYLSSRFYDYMPQYSREEQLCFGLQYEELTGSTKFVYWPDIPPTEEELTSLNCNVKAKLSSMQPMIYIDEFTGRNNWVDR